MEKNNNLEEFNLEEFEKEVKEELKKEEDLNDDELSEKTENDSLEEEKEKTKKEKLIETAEKVRDEISEKVEKSKEKAEEVVNDLKEKMNDETEPKEVEINIANVMKKVSTFNKNYLFDKILFGIVSFMVLFMLRMLFHILTFSRVAKNSRKIGELNLFESGSDMAGAFDKVLKKAYAITSSNGFLTFLIILALIILIYYVYEYINEKKPLFTTTNIATFSAIIFLLIGKYFFRVVIRAIKAVRSNDLSGLLSLGGQIENIESNTTIATIFFILSFIILCLTWYLLFAKIFLKKKIKIRFK